MDTQPPIVLNRLHEAGGLIDELELAVADAASQSERLREKLTYVVGVTAPPCVPRRLRPSQLATTTATRYSRI
jgi:hypothetical protein